MKKGYLAVLFFALFKPVSCRYFYSDVVARGFSEAALYKLIIQSIILFGLFATPKLILTRWYYKQKDNMR